jgi:threonine dehydratase
VPEPAIAGALRDLATHDRLIAEGAAAAAVACLAGLEREMTGRHIGVLLSGRNVDRPAAREKT